MRNTGVDTMWDGAVIKEYGFTQRLNENTRLPSVTLYANEGDTLVIIVRNISQGDPHTVHPHGMDADQANDGTPMTSFSVGHMEEATYRIYCSHAGTYIYHCHMADVVHVQMGMYGLVVVRPKDGSKRAWTDGPAYDKEYAWLMSEIDKAWHDSVPQNPNHMDSLAHDDFEIPPYRPDYFLVQGKAKHELKESPETNVEGKVGEKIYLRLANIGFYLNEVVFPASAGATWMASDGRPLPKPIKGDTLQIAPGERFGVMLTPTQEVLDSIAIRFINMNTYEVWDTEYVPYTIKGNVGMHEFDYNQYLEAYPNPATQSISVRIPENVGGPVTIRLYNTLGQVAYMGQFTHTSAAISVDLAGIPAGVYSLHASANSFSASKKVVVKH